MKINGLSLTMCTVCIILITSVFSISQEIPGEIKDIASEYRGYDESVSNITTLKYKNQTYYWVEYSKTLMYSGALLIDEDSQLITDKKILLTFSAADIIHKNFKKANARQLAEFSRYFGSLAGSLAGNFDDPSMKTVANDSLEISQLLLNSSQCLKEGIDTFSPDDVEDYLYLESRIIKKIRAAHVNSRDITETERNSHILKNYRNSLSDIFESITENRENLLKSADYISQNIESRVSSKDKGAETEMILVAITALLMIFVFVIRKFKHQI